MFKRLIDGVSQRQWQGQRFISHSGYSRYCEVLEIHLSSGETTTGSAVMLIQQQGDLFFKQMKVVLVELVKAAEVEVLSGFRGSE